MAKNVRSVLRLTKPAGSGIAAHTSPSLPREAEKFNNYDGEGHTALPVFVFVDALPRDLRALY